MRLLSLLRGHLRPPKSRVFPTVRPQSTAEANAFSASAADSNPRLLRVAIVGSGPSGLYAADSLLSATTRCTLDLFEKLPTPFGLVRYGVAPDHPEVKQAEQRFTRVLSHEKVRFLGNVSLGADVTLAELCRRYHAVILASGADADRSMELPVISETSSSPSSSSSSSSSSPLSLFPRILSAREWVAFVNGHPDYAALMGSFDASFRVADENIAWWRGVGSVAVVGVGNVALDVARIMTRPVEDLAGTDISPVALEFLRCRAVKHVHLVARRGPLQAAYTIAELRELASIPSVRLLVDSNDLVLDSASEALLKTDRPRRRQYELLQSIAKQRQLFLAEANADVRYVHLHFYASPLGIRMQRNEKASVINSLVVERTKLEGDIANPRAVSTSITKDIACEMIVQSIGYKCAKIPGVPLDEKKGTIANNGGRVVFNTTIQEPVAKNVYVCGWAKRGPSGIIGTNRWDAQETVRALLQDWNDGLLEDPPMPNSAQNDILRFLTERGHRVITYRDWQIIDSLETRMGAATGKVRSKFLSPRELFQALDSEKRAAKEVQQ